MKKYLLKAAAQARSWNLSEKTKMIPLMIFLLLTTSLLFQNCSATKFNPITRDIASTSTAINNNTLETPQDTTSSTQDTSSTPSTPTAVCTMGSHTSEGCPSITNGNSQKYCASNGTQWGACVSSCLSGYNLSGNQPNILCTAPAVTTGNATTTTPPSTVKPQVLVDNVPDYFAFKDVMNVEPYAWITTETITVTGLEPNYEFLVGSTNGNVNQYLVDAGTTSLSGVFANPKVVKTSSNGSFRLALKTLSAGWGDWASSTLTGNFTVTSQLYVKPNPTTSNVLNYADDSSFKFCGPQRTNCFSVNWNITTRQIKFQGIIIDQFGSVASATSGSFYTSNVVTVSGLEPNHKFSISANSSIGDTQIDAGTDSLTGQFTYQWKEVTTSPSGTIKVAFKARAPIEAGATNSTKLVLSFNNPIEITGSVFTVKTAGP